MALRTARNDGPKSNRDRFVGRPSWLEVCLWSLAALVVVGSLAGVVVGASTVIGFEEYGDGTELTTLYSASGVVFEVQEGESTGAIINTCGPQDEQCRSARNGRNVVATPVDFFELDPTQGFRDPGFVQEPLVASFPEPQQDVWLYVREAEWSDGSQTAELVARDASGNVVDESSLQFEAGTGWHRLAVSTRSARISEVTLTLANTTNPKFQHNYFIVDDLSFRVNEPPTATFGVSTRDPTVDDPVTFTSTSFDSDGEIVEYRWDFNSDDVVDSVTQTPTASTVFDEPDRYWVTLEVEDDEGATDSTTRIVSIAAAPLARCSVSDTEVEPGEQVVIDASESTAELVRFNIQGGEKFDRTDQSDFREVVTYSDSGSFTPVVRAEIGSRSDTEPCQTILVNQVPTAVLDDPPDGVTVGESVTFDASQSFDLDGEIVEYRWDFDDDGFSDRTTTTTPWATHTFREAGTHGVSVTVVDDDEGVREARTSIRINQPQPLPWDVALGVTGGLLGVWTLCRVRSCFDRPRSNDWDDTVPPDDGNGENNEENHPPTADIRYTPETLAPGQPVLFDGAASFDPDSGDKIWSYQWTIESDHFTTPKSFSTPRFVSAFVLPAEYRVSLTVFDKHGLLTTATETVTVEENAGALVLDQVHPDAPGNDHDNLAEEWIAFKNDGTGTLHLGGWTVHDAAADEGRVTEGDHTFVVPEGFQLAPGATVTVHTGAAPDTGDEFEETDEERHLFWGKHRAIWNNEGDVIVVEDDSGHPVLADRYERTDAGDYDIEPLDFQLLESWFLDVTVSSREDAPLVSTRTDTGLVRGVLSNLYAFVAGAVFLGGPRAFLDSWIVITGFLFSSSMTWGITTWLGVVSRSIDVVVPLLSLLVALLMLLLGGMGLVLQYTISGLRGRLT